MTVYVCVQCETICRHVYLPMYICLHLLHPCTCVGHACECVHLIMYCVSPECRVTDKMITALCVASDIPVLCLGNCFHVFVLWT